VNQGPFNNHLQVTQSQYKEHQGGMSGPTTSTTGTSVTSHQTPL